MVRVCPFTSQVGKLNLKDNEERTGTSKCKERLAMRSNPFVPCVLGLAAHRLGSTPRGWGKFPLVDL